MAGGTPFGEGRRLRVPGGSLYYPDFFAVCGPRGDDLHDIVVAPVVSAVEGEVTQPPRTAPPHLDHDQPA
jgi:hypothetical protein